MAESAPHPFAPVPRPPADQHTTSVHRPADFDAFWRVITAEVDALPLDPTIESVPLRSTEDVAVFNIGYNSLDGVRIAGWYCTPRAEVIAPPYPGLLVVPGYVSEPAIPKAWARKGYATVGVAPRGKLRSHHQVNPGYPGLLTSNITDKHTYGYRGFYIDAYRAVDFLLTRPEVDPARIGIMGSSQGGALTVTTAALRNDVITCGAASAPYLCGFMDSIALTHSYPYEEINDYLRLYPEREHAVRDTVAYFDGINFAPWITCPLLISVGLADDICPPETAFDLYEALDCPKEIHAYPRCGHEAGAHWENVNIEAFLAGHLRPVAGLSREIERTGEDRE